MADEKELLNKAEIDRMLTRMAFEILEVHKGAENLVFIGIQTRGVHLAKRLRAIISKSEKVEIPTGDIDISMYRDDWTRIGSNPIVQATDISFSLDGKQVILVDDVLFTGRTTRAAMDALMDFGRPDRIELAVLIDRGFRELPIMANYTGKIIETSYQETINVLLTEQDGVDRVMIIKD